MGVWCLDRSVLIQNHHQLPKGELQRLCDPLLSVLELFDSDVIMVESWLVVESGEDSTDLAHRLAKMKVS